jgi:signal recognition particle subunit SRP54
MIQKMGSLKDLVDKLPLGNFFPGGLPKDINLDDRELVRIEAMIQSMTHEEKRDPYSLVREPKRAERIAKGSGSATEAVNELVQKFLFMKQMMGNLGQNMGMMGKIPGMKQLSQMKNMRQAMSGMGGGGGGGFPGMGMPGMGGFPGMPGMGMPGMGMPGMGGGGADSPSMTKMRSLSQTERNAKKGQRKRERDARKKARK